MAGITSNILDSLSLTKFACLRNQIWYYTRVAKEKKIFGTFDPYDFTGNWKEKPSKTFGIHVARVS